MRLFATVSRGNNKGIRVTPNLYEDGTYHVSKKKEDEPILVRNYADLEGWVARGYGIRMGNKENRHPPGLQSPKSIRTAR
jgi:hypothetical protein